MADRRKYEELVSVLRDRGDDDLADEFEKWGTSSLRNEAARVPELEKRVTELESENTGLKRAPQRDKAFRDYGVDMDALRPAERRALETYDGELEPEKLAAFVEEFDLPLVTGNGEQADQGDRPAAAGVAAVARSAPAGRRAGAAQITPQDAENWSPERLTEFGQKYPEAMNELLQGKTVTGITFP
jgi:hypothetical protein